MFVTRIAAGAFFFGVLMLGTNAALSQDKYPDKLIRFVTATPGSNHDWGARITAQALALRIGKRVIVENRGSIAVEHVAREAQPDGYTVLFYGAYCWLQPLLAKVKWDPVTDLAPITLAMSSPNVLVVHPSLPVKSVRELIALAKARPGDLNYSAGGGGSTPHVAGELFKYLAGVKIVRIRYKGSGPSMIGLMTGEVQLMFGALGPTLPLIRQGKVRALAISTLKRSPLVPDLPPVADVLPGFSAGAAIGFFVPKRTSPAIVKFLHQEIVPALKGLDPKLLAVSGVEIIGNTPEEFAAFIKADMSRMSNMLKSAHFSN